MLAELAAIGGVVLDLVSATASTAVDIARMVFDLLALFVNWTINAVEQLFNFETSQPIAFILVFGTAFAVFALTPIVFGFNYNTALFGSPGESVQGGISAEPSSIQNMTDAEIAAIINDIELARLPSNPSVKLVQLRTVSSFFGGPSLFKTLFPQTSKLAEQDAGMFLYLNTMDNARVQWANQRYQQCGKIAFTETTPNNTVWEMVIRPTDAKLSKRMTLAVTNPYMRAWNASVSCYSAVFNDSTNMTIPGATKEDQANFLKTAMQNGSICDDVSFEQLRPSLNGYTVTNPVANIGFQLFNIGTWLSAVTGLQKPVATPECWIMYNASSHQRFYTGVPYWLKEAGVENSTAYIIDGDVILSSLSFTPEELAGMKAVNFNVTTQQKAGLLDLPLIPYRLFKDTTVKVSGGAALQPFQWFETAMVVLLVAILGLVGVVMVLNMAKIKTW